MPINPVQFAHGVCDEFLRYLFSAFPLSDPELADQARKLLERPSSLDIPLVKGPFVSLSESFAKGESVQKMANDGFLHSVMPGLIGYPTMYLHQQQVFEAVRGGGFVVQAQYGRAKPRHHDAAACLDAGAQVVECECTEDTLGGKIAKLDGDGGDDA